MLKRQFIGWILYGLLCGASVSALYAQIMEVPVETQLQLFAKILSYDRNLHVRTGGRGVLGIIYQHTYKASSSAKDDMLKSIGALPQVKMGDIPFRVELIDLEGTDDLAAELEKRGVTVAYITPLRAFQLETLLEATREQKILTLTGVSSYVDGGVSISIGLLNQRPQILINLPSSKAEGAEFNSHFLKLVKVLQ